MLWCFVNVVLYHCSCVGMIDSLRHFVVVRLDILLCPLSREA